MRAHRVDHGRHTAAKNVDGTFMAPGLLQCAAKKRCALTLMIAVAVWLAAGGLGTADSPRPQRAPSTDLSALDLLELQIGYTTLLATFDGPVTPRQIAGGARVGVAAYLVSRHIRNAKLPYVPQRLTRDDGGEFVDGTVLNALLRYGKRLHGDDIVQAALAGEAASLNDPYTLLFHPAAFKRFNAFLGNDTFGGIGAVVTLEPDGRRARIESVIPGSPRNEPVCSRPTRSSRSTQCRSTARVPTPFATHCAARSERPCA